METDASAMSGNLFAHVTKIYKYNSGKPDGGRGGSGGSVKFKADKNSKDLSTVLHCYNAKKGENGSSRGRCGRDASDMIVPVPVGTVVYDDSSGEQLADLDHQEDQYIGVIGGIGGEGNIVNQEEEEWSYSDEGTHGEEGSEVILRLEMKLLADVGLVRINYLISIHACCVCL